MTQLADLLNIKLPWYVYLTILIFGIMFAVLKEVLEIEIPGSAEFSLSLPYAMFVWGIFGLAGVTEPSSFLMGFCGVLIIFYMVYNSVIYDYDAEAVIIGTEAEVTVPFGDERSSGEIKFMSRQGMQFRIAKGTSDKKGGFKKGDLVYIQAIEGAFAVIGSNKVDYTIKRKPVERVNTLRKLLRELRFRPNKDELCQICYSKVSYSELVNCPWCDAKFHENHLADWLSVSPRCPNCRQGLLMHDSSIIKRN